MHKKACDVVDRVEHAGTVVIAAVGWDGVSKMVGAKYIEMGIGGGGVGWGTTDVGETETSFK